MKSRSAVPATVLSLFCFFIGLILIGLATDRSRTDLLIGLIGVASLTLSLSQITPLRQMQRRRLIPDPLSDAIDTFTDGLLILDEQQRIVLANEALAAAIGIPRRSLIGRHAGGLNWQCSRLAARADFPWARVLRQNHDGDDGAGEPEQLLSYQLEDGELRFFSVKAARIRSGDASRRGVLVTLRDVTTQEHQRADTERTLAMLRFHREEIGRKNRELQTLANRDDLTGCLNRREFIRRCEAAIRDSRRRQTTLACLMLDSDHFKRINDTHGHAVGDQVLRAIAATITDVVGESGDACRWGGEEFCVILPGYSAATAAAAADRILCDIRALRIAAAPDLRLTISIGVALCGDDLRDPADLIARADQYLYVAKDQGRNRVVAQSS